MKKIDLLKSLFKKLSKEIPTGNSKEIPTGNSKEIPTGIYKEIPIKVNTKSCKNINISSLKTKCNLIESKEICEKNHKNIKKNINNKINNQKDNTFYKKILHTLYKKNNPSIYLEDNEEKEILNKLKRLNELNNKFFPKYKLTYLNIDKFKTINMHIIDFLIDRSLYEFMDELNIYMKKINKKILCSDGIGNELCKNNKNNKNNKNYMIDDECDKVCIKNKYFLTFIIDKLITVDLYQLLIIILKRFNESFNNKSSYFLKKNDKKGFNLFEMNGDNIEIDFLGLYYFIYEDLVPFTKKINCSYIVKLIINIISYYIDNIHRHYDSTKSISKKQIDNIKSYAKFVDYLPDCQSLDILKTELNKFITKIANKENKGTFIDISKLDFWYDIPKLVIKILADGTLTYMRRGVVSC